MICIWEALGLAELLHLICIGTHIHSLVKHAYTDIYVHINTYSYILSYILVGPSCLSHTSHTYTRARAHTSNCVHMHRYGEQRT